MAVTAVNFESSESSYLNSYLYIELTTLTKAEKIAAMGSAGMGRKLQLSKQKKTLIEALMQNEGVFSVIDSEGYRTTKRVTDSQ